MPDASSAHTTPTTNDEVVLDPETLAEFTAQNDQLASKRLREQARDVPTKLTTPQLKRRAEWLVQSVNNQFGAGSKLQLRLIRQLGATIWQALETRTYLSEATRDELRRAISYASQLKLTPQHFQQEAEKRFGS